ncbi:carboxypeptidase regulatory-like domain-containing protein [Desulfobulbus sp. US1]|nr:carboxypeptidase regulatory-like domain-containing protein [Desulfobulbus sp. US4]MCW5208701.1 carboxypeptidase regulatory-like domain-containing protein [Desulfobulbus sp. US1]MCW5210506.1 carboxypeptidase regulatory-like domain-containing protein [Desulfobulbus sp. N3]MCW5213855.1 carboxypeptidase regulatory-like domain-containing protein [Desulfobulbus sp. US5]
MTRKYVLVFFSVLVVCFLGLVAPVLAATISGTVTDSNGPVEGISVGIGICLSGYLGVGCGLVFVTAVTGTDGMYMFLDRPAGGYYVAAPSNWKDTPYVYQNKDALVTEEGQNIQIDFQLELGPSIRGSIYQADGETLTDDTYRVRFQESCTVLGDEPEVAAVSGLYSSPVLPAGDYYLALLNEAGEFIGWRTALEIPSTNCADAVSVHVDENQLMAINFILKNQIVLMPIYHMLLRN